VHTPPAQRDDVFPDRRVLPHLGVHRGTDEHRRTGGEQGCAQQVVRNSRRVAANQAGRGGRHHYRIGVPAELDVRYNVAGSLPGGARARALTEQGSPGRFRCKGAKSERPDKPGGSLREDGAHESPCIAQAPADLDCLVGGDPSAHTEDDPLARKRRR
jgi:hypothetical protein